MGDGALAIAHVLFEANHGSITIDWTQQEAVRAEMRWKVKQPLRNHGYPLDKQQGVGLVVMEQAERARKDWAGA